ncbi:DUF4054 domain-containing protein [Yersinia enterocolitica]|uniref:DUF4054 domain-containing protein n=1 Tax=Yersinia enterocolitica TaxID=630 RepID=UPI0021E8D6F2|nr:DUF4054 domain-containing protein [Yersinia enterocolitica]EKN5130134.1 DUF4054 domain-containing protein [Yersinia enterocolitica]UYJ99855.1 DUF4054 domain-containing protein [Yersinia enterocolitica]
MEFIVRYPEFTSTAPARIEGALADAANQMSRKVWGRLYEQGHQALAAHLLYSAGALTPSGNSNGNPMKSIASRSVAGVSIGYSAPDAGFGANHDGYASSGYGQEYIRLRKLVGVHVLAIR